MKRGFGTNFHSVYANNADSYNLFSKTEIFSDILLKRLKQLFTGSVMLDIACGTCHKTNLFSPYFKKVFALDKSKNLLQLGNKLYSKNSKIIFLLSSADNIPLLDNSVDTILITWGSFPLNKTLKEIKRVLRPGGVAIRIGAYGLDDFTVMFPKFDIKRINRIKKTFEKNGFSSEKHKTSINFSNIDEAKNILNTILGIPKKDIKFNKINHDVILNYYKKPL